MDKLPQEVIDRIAGYLFPHLASGGKYDHLEDSPGPAECATISRPWKRTIEAMTFRRLGVLSRDDIPDAKYLLGSDPHRRASVERIDYTIRFDKHPIWNATEYHRLRDRQLIQQFRHLINFINEIWPTSINSAEDTHVQSIILVVNIVGFSKWDASQCDESGFTQELIALNDLPSCPAVTSFAMFYDEIMKRDFHPKHENFMPQKIDETGVARENGTKVPPAWIMNILAKFPSAKLVDCELYNFITRSWKRHNMQEELCTALSGPAFSHIQNLSLWFGPFDFSARSLRGFLSYGYERRLSSDPPVTPTDSLNSVLRTLSQQLQELHIHGLFSVSPDLFTNRDDETGNQPNWPHLRVLQLTTTLLTPSGNKWLIPPHRFQGRAAPGAFTIDPTLCNATIEFNKLMTALSRGMLSMPRLELLTLDFLTGPAEPVWDHVDWTGDWTRHGVMHGDRQVQVPGKTYELVRYVRADNESREMAQLVTGGIREKPAEGNRFCTLAVLNEQFIWNKVVSWRPFPKEAVENWNELHKRIKGLTELEEWRRM